MNGPLNDAAVNALLAGGEWTRSRRGNLTRMVGHLRLTVFRVPNGRYRWCVCDGVDVGYCADTFATEQRAAADASETLEGEG
jgi:hypothetical protein